MEGQNYNDVENGGATGPSLPREQCPGEILRKRHLELYRAAINGKWETAKFIYAEFPGDISASITEDNDTALHIAAIGQHTSFVKNLVNMMSIEDLAIKNKLGMSAFLIAVGSGKKELCEIMLTKNKNLAMIRDGRDMLPVHAAASSGHNHMTWYLYRLTGAQLNDNDCDELLIRLIHVDLYDTALTLVENHPKTAITNKIWVEALSALAEKHLASLDLANQNQNRGVLETYISILFSGIELPRSNLYSSQALQLFKRIWERVILGVDLDASALTDLIFTAAQVGNVELIRILINDFPSLIRATCESGETIFHIAVSHRHSEILELLNELGSRKDMIFAIQDSKGNNILHSAGSLGPAEGPNNLSDAAPGAALQLQQELMFFKRVETIAGPAVAKVRNKDRLTPWEVFVRNHRELQEKGEKWMKNTSNSLMVVATLIAAMVFTATLTIPGGNKQDTGVPVFNHQLSFKIFAISVAMSLLYSLCSILTFISIHTSTYKIDDFLESLPLKFITGLLGLTMSVASMVIVFCSAFLIIFRDGLLGFAYTIFALSSVLVLSFYREILQLFGQRIRLTSYFHLLESKFQVT